MKLEKFYLFSRCSVWVEEGGAPKFVDFPGIGGVAGGL
jgi:hypothetical protein